MDFPTAMKAIVEGRRVRKLEWQKEEPDAYAMERDGWLMLWRKGEWHTWQVSSGDMRGTDWLVED